MKRRILIVLGLVVVGIPLFAFLAWHLSTLFLIWMGENP